MYGNKRSQARQRERGKQKGWDRLVLVSSCFQRSFDIHPWKALLVGCCWLLLLVCSTGDLLKHCLAIYIYIIYIKYSLTVSLEKNTAFPIRCPGERSKYTQEIREDETHGIGGGQNKSKQQPNMLICQLCFLRSLTYQVGKSTFFLVPKNGALSIAMWDLPTDGLYVCKKQFCDSVSV